MDDRYPTKTFLALPLRVNYLHKAQPPQIPHFNIKNSIFIFLLLSTTTYGQLTMAVARDTISQYRLGYSTYFEPFLEKPGYGAPWIMTADGGAAAFGDGQLYKFDKTGKKAWMRRVKPGTNEGETESQSVAQDKKGNLYVFLLSYPVKGYRGGSERVVCFDKTGKQLWDKPLGAYTLMNNPTVSYIKTADDGRIYMRGHVVKEEPVEGKDPVYRYWEGWLDITGKLTQKAGDQIDWGKDEWQKKFKPE
jgi:hypothetical protein